MDTKLLVLLHQYVYNPDGNEADTWDSVFPGYKFFVMDFHGLSSGLAVWSRTMIPSTNISIALMRMKLYTGLDFPVA